MRGAAAYRTLIVACILGVAGEALARAGAPHVASSMSPGADLGQLQSAALEWIRATASSSQFIVGLVLGVALAEGGRFLWHWIWRGLQGAMAATRFVIHHRLIALVAGIASYYVVARYVLA